jgi:membrane protease YdiL (CAAX protease family)
LTVRSESLLPPILAHWLYNLLPAKASVEGIPGYSIVFIGLWTMLAVMLFHYWPVAQSNAASDPALGPEAVV